MPANPTFGDDRMIRSCPSRFSGVGHRRKTVALSFRSRLAAKLCLLASAHYIAHSQCQFAHCRALRANRVVIASCLRRNRVFGKRAMLCGEVRRALLFANRCGTMPDLSAFGHFDEVSLKMPLSGLYLSTVALMWTFCPSRTKAGTPTEPSWKSLQTIPSNLKLRES